MKIQPLEGIDLTNKIQPNLVFIDMETSRKNGFRMLKKFSEINFKIVFVSKVAEHALEAIKDNALDYLLKLIKENDLRDTLKRYQERVAKENLIRSSSIKNKAHLAQTTSKKILLAVHKGYKLMNVNDIMYCESSGRYTVVYLIDGTKLKVSRTRRTKLLNILKSYKAMSPRQRLSI